MIMQPEENSPSSGIATCYFPVFSGRPQHRCRSATDGPAVLRTSATADDYPSRREFTPLRLFRCFFAVFTAGAAVDRL
jgi:hypothetical protein